MAFHDAVSNISHRSQSPPNLDPNHDTNHTPSRPTQIKPPGHASSTDGRESVSSLDPRRFTPTLHANLVSEILSLRRDIDNKNKLIFGLEDQLSGAEQENGQLNQQLQNFAHESRNLKRNLQTLEGGSEHAIKKIAEERDTAVGIVKELRQRLDFVQKKLRSCEDEMERVNSLWESDKNDWEEQRRIMNRRIHTADSRLQILAKELDFACGEQILGESSVKIDEQNFHRPVGVDHRDECASESAKYRDEIDDGANTNHDAQRSPHYTRSSGEGSALMKQSLAAELGDHFDYVSSDDGSSREVHQADNISTSRSSSSKSDHGTEKAKNILGPDAMKIPEAMHVQEELSGPKLDKRSKLYGPSTSHTVQPSYADVATQYSRGLSPTRSPCVNDLAKEDSAMLQNDGAGPADLSCEVNGNSTSGQIMTAGHSGKQANILPQDTASQVHPSATYMCSASTQTDPITETGLCWNSAHIAVIRSDNSLWCTTCHRYGNEANLPLNLNISNLPGSKFIHRRAPTQTDLCSPNRNEADKVSEITTELLPCAGKYHSDIPQKRLPSVTKSLEPDRVLQQSSFRDDESANFDVRPRQYYHVLDAQTETAMNVENERDDSIADLTDDSAVSRYPVKRVLTKTKNGWKSLTSLTIGFQPSLSTQKLHPGELGNSNALKESTVPNVTIYNSSNDNGSERPPEPDTNAIHPSRSDLSTAKPSAVFASDTLQAGDMTRRRAESKRTKKPNIRKMALVSSGTSAHRQTPPNINERVTSTNDLKYDPPFPVPDRSSSRKLPYEQDPSSLIEGSVTFYGLDHDFRDRKASRKVAKRARSMSIFRYSPSQEPSFVSTKSRPTHGFDPGDSQVISARESPQGLVPLPFEDQNILAPHRPGRKGATSLERFHSGQSSAVASRQTSASPQPTSVVDAIAETMIGEWMWKYVRRRKSFGLHESPVAEFERGKSSDTGTARHRRWVWLAPYERAVMWSSKQPTSGSALMGKNGRKLVVQSVLDVRDDTPLPKEAHGSSFFGRSILVLTAQRALKFTAIDKERHIIWLTALSFLCHSSVLPQAPPITPPVPSLHTSPSLTSDRLIDRPSISGIPNPRQAVEASTLTGDASNASSKYLTTIVEPKYSGNSTALHDPMTKPYDRALAQEDIEGDDDAAEAPLVPRFATRSRKKSNLNLSVPGRPSFKKLSSSKALTSKLSVQYLHATDLSTNLTEQTGGWATDNNEAIAYAALDTSHQIARTTSQPSRFKNRSDEENLAKGENSFSGLSEGMEYGLGRNYLEAIGTLRMQAFVDGFDNEWGKRSGRGDNRANRSDQENV